MISESFEAHPGGGGKAEFSLAVTFPTEPEVTLNCTCEAYVEILEDGPGLSHYRLFFADPAYDAVALFSMEPGRPVNHIINVSLLRQCGKSVDREVREITMRLYGHQRGEGTEE